MTLLLLFADMQMHQRVSWECSSIQQMESKTNSSPRTSETSANIVLRSCKAQTPSAESFRIKFLYLYREWWSVLFVICEELSFSLPLLFSASRLCTQQIFRYPLVGYYTVQEGSKFSWDSSAEQHSVECFQGKLRIATHHPACICCTSLLTWSN